MTLEELTERLENLSTDLDCHIEADHPARDDFWELNEIIADMARDGVIFAEDDDEEG